MRSPPPASRSSTATTPTTSWPASRSASIASSVEPPVVTTSSTTRQRSPGSSSGPSTRRCRPCCLGLLAHEERLDVGAAGQRGAGDRVGAHRHPADRGRPVLARRARRRARPARGTRRAAGSPAWRRRSTARWRPLVSVTSPDDERVRRAARRSGAQRAVIRCRSYRACSDARSASSASSLCAIVAGELRPVRDRPGRATARRHTRADRRSRATRRSSRPTAEQARARLDAARRRARQDRRRRTTRPAAPFAGHRPERQRLGRRTDRADAARAARLRLRARLPRALHATVARPSATGRAPAQRGRRRPGPDRGPTRRSTPRRAPAPAGSRGWR